MADESSSEALPKVAFLGPVGTYTHQIAITKFGENVEFVERPTIAAVFDAISDGVLYGVVPQQNSTFGSVVEMYDNLRRQTMGSSIFIHGEVTMAIRHCLVIRPGVKSEELTRILSHEQALGQCLNYLSTHHPNATRHKVSSTAKAAQLLLSGENNFESKGESAAICSALCAQTMGLEILQENIQDGTDNLTRFFVLSSTLDVMSPYAPHPPELFRALVRLSVLHSEDEPPHPSIANRPLQLVMSTLLTTFGIPVTRINRRPSLAPTPFEDVYFIELEELGSPPDPNDIGDRSVSYSRWLSKVREAVQRAEACGVEAVLLGAW